MNVLRIKPGETVELFDGQGTVVLASVDSMNRREVHLSTQSQRIEDGSQREVILGTAVPKGDRFDWLIEKATELGVTRIVPLITNRSSVDPRESKLDKLKQTVIAACKQSGRNHLLELSPVTSFEVFIRNELQGRNSFIAHPSSDDQSISREEAPIGASDSVVVMIGPEGGFTDEEIEQALSSGASRISLGPFVLRIETAALAVAAIFALPRAPQCRFL